MGFIGLDACHFQDGWEEIFAGDRGVDACARNSFSRPVNHHRLTDAAFIDRGLAFAQRLVLGVCDAPLGRIGGMTAVVTVEYDNGIICNALFLLLFHDIPQTLIYAFYH